jgi:hypothetical protein
MTVPAAIQVGTQRPFSLEKQIEALVAREVYWCCEENAVSWVHHPEQSQDSLTSMIRLSCWTEAPRFEKPNSRISKS